MNKPFINEKVLKEFEPLYTKTELEIKGLIRDYVTLNKSEFELVGKINKIIETYKEELPKELPNHDVFVLALIQSSSKWLMDFKRRIDGINAGLIFLVKKDKKVVVMSEQNSIVENLKRAIPFQGTPNVDNYQRELANAVSELATSPFSDNYEPNKRRASVFARAELELRHQHQMMKIQQLQADGKVLRRFTTHASASERCEHWQGKLIDLNAEPVNQKMETGELYKGEKIYSFKGITNAIDKYGYKNNIIVGWNCRHDMIDPDYKDNITEYTKEEIEKWREVNARQRELERRIREMRKEEYLSLTKAKSERSREKARLLTKEYENYSKSNNVAMAKWRLDIPMKLRGLADY